VGITLGYKIEHKEVIIEVPILADRHFMIIQNMLLIEDGSNVFQRKVFDTVGGKKHKLLMS
jgi:hypothetical protein